MKQKRSQRAVAVMLLICLVGGVILSSVIALLSIFTNF